MNRDVIEGRRFGFAGRGRERDGEYACQNERIEEQKSLMKMGQGRLPVQDALGKAFCPIRR